MLPVHKIMLPVHQSMLLVYQFMLSVFQLMLLNLPYVYQLMLPDVHQVM